MRYVRLPELLTELAIARGKGTYPKIILQYKKPALLILDEWLLYPLKETEDRDLLEIAETRYKKSSTIFCSQFDVLGWREISSNDKEKSTEKIDGAVATIMALDRAIRCGNDTG